MSNNDRTANPQTGGVQSCRKKPWQRRFFRLHRDKNANSWFSHPVWQAQTQPVLWHHNPTGRYYRYQMAGEGG
ncbi:hypothetical protein SAMN05720354_101214 [Nitrosospira sp. Nsp1]|nr:hypothetical protein SAMN05720354_101214 [Nitrosospira sp. Nsp1]